MALISIEDFFRCKDNDEISIIDVRSPIEYNSGHIIGARNLPLFSDKEREAVGTIYTKQGKNPAVLKGLEFVGPKMADIVKEVRRISGGKKVVLYCFRGGMRSESVAWLLKTVGLDVDVVKGGYKAYRSNFKAILDEFSWKFYVITGKTGCGKSEVLEELSKMGEQVLDLENLACHRGSAFGAIGMNQQPTTEQYINLLHEKLYSFDKNRPIIVEGESQLIGHVFIPDELWQKLSTAISINYSIPLEYRIEKILETYGSASKEELKTAFNKISKRLGLENAKNAISCIEKGELAEAISIALKYYDKAYGQSIAKESQIFTKDYTHGNIKIIANEIKEKIYETYH